MTTPFSRNSNSFNTPSAAVRSSFLGLALVVTMALLASVGGMADQQYDKALLAQAGSQPTQVVLVTGHRIGHA